MRLPKSGYLNFITCGIVAFGVCALPSFAATKTETISASCTGILQNTEVPTKDRGNSLRFKLARTNKHIQRISRPGDRIAIKLTTDYSRLPWTLLSPQGRLELLEILTFVDPIEVLNGVAEKFGISSDEAKKLLFVDGEAYIRKMLAARNKGNWDEVIRIYDGALKGPWQNVTEAKLQASLALNRRNKGDDRQRALKMTAEVIAHSRGQMILSEAYGIRGHIFKDIYDESKDPIDLEKAIETYLKGFSSNPFDYYPGVAGLNLVLLRSELQSSEVHTLIRKIKYAVQHAFQRLQDNDQLPDHWLLVTSLRIHVLLEEWDQVAKLVPDVLASSGGSQNLSTTVSDYKRILSSNAPGMSNDFKTQLSNLIQLLELGSQSEQKSLVLTANSPSFVTTQTFPDMENAFKTTPFNLKEEISRSGIEDELLAAKQFGNVQIHSFHEMLQKSSPASAEAQPILLAPTGPYRDVVQAISEQVGMIPWWKAHDLVGLPTEPTYTEEFLKRSLKAKRHLYLMIPRNFREDHAGSFTLNEYEHLLKLFPEYKDQIHFVFGFEHTYPLEFKKRLSPDEVSKNYATNITRYFTSKYSSWLKKLGDDVKKYRLGIDFNSSLYPLIYDQVLSQLSYHRQLRRLHSQYAPKSRSNSNVSIIDAGGGTGLVARQLLEDDPSRQVEIFDTSESMTRIAIAKATKESVHLSSILNLRRSNGESVANNSVDGITCSNVIYILSKADVVKFLNESHRVLKAGGRLTISSMRFASQDVHSHFMNLAVTETLGHEESGLVPRGGAQILSSSNNQLLNQSPSLFSFEEIKELAEAAGFNVKFQTTTYEGAGFFVVLDKITD